MNVRHTAINVSDAIQSILDECSISLSKIASLVTEYNMLKAADELKMKCKHLNCFARTLKLLITDSLQDPDAVKLLRKANYVNNFKANSVAR